MMKKYFRGDTQQNGHLTQHKKFVLYGTHHNFCFARTFLCRKPYI